jgi:anaerobic magnesium-protoporphyrin IX monomethyl ester cyclase
MSDIDFLLVSQSNVVDYDGYAELPLERADLYKSLVYPRMVHHEGKFRGHLDYINRKVHGQYYGDADYPDRRRLLNIWNMPSMSGVHLANYLGQFGIRVRVINNIDSEWDWFADAYRSCERPPLVGISTTFYLSWKEIGRVAKKLRAFDPDMDIVMGGAFANAQATSGEVNPFEKPMRRHGIRFMLHAFNSEPDLRDLILARKDDKATDTVRNLCRIDGSFATGTFVAGTTSWNEPLLSEIPPHWDRLDLPFLNRTIQIRTASGCPFACAFCSYPTTARGWKTLDSDYVRAHLDAIARIPGVDRIVFIDDTFNVPPHRFRELVRIFSEYSFEWFSFLRVQYVDDHLVGMMKDSGCRGVYLGIESASDAVLANMNKRARKANFAKGVELLNKHDIDYLAAFVLGFPGETDKTIRENIDFINDNGVRYYSLKEFYYMENTKVHEKRDAYGLTGTGNKWSHATMSAQEASQIKLDMFLEIDSSTNIDPDTSLWYLTYLYDQNFSFPQIKQMQDEINDLMKVQLRSIETPLDVPDQGAAQRVQTEAVL